MARILYPCSADYQRKRKNTLNYNLLETENLLDWIISRCKCCCLIYFTARYARLNVLHNYNDFLVVLSSQTFYIIFSSSWYLIEQEYYVSYLQYRSFVSDRSARSASQTTHKISHLIPVCRISICCYFN